ncbi:MULTISPECIES: protein-glutamate methylesterase/protein-glutamine glutaminase [Pontibacillus]|uniref:Protein-glutamate methylesterase/protein-glutamine glutaminase n=1 Tax=Pontibacillus chungwhensis TaxID=265426 RepID=A0ABY8V2K8_9BACI|nr:MULTISPECIES: chemotaxis response regulator protein-glutamate methylesterase [Pontibacillus]MCD5322703.1 chemotaxis response regulator protein-glutamate methylesterase [Pontibacillus sp. HN14]WIF99979.1 chemotaxis response regulator protein-glutamate methylesterase [Pontibacillus chungwhensis]
MNTIRVLVVDDSAFMRKMIRDILEADHRITVVGTARNGEDGLLKVQQLSPDIITLDVEMPKMDGLTCLKEIMKNHPLPVVMLSSMTKSGGESTLKAMEYGAVDFIEKPSGAISLNIESIAEQIVGKVIAASRANLREVQKAQQPPVKTIHPNRFAYSKSKQDLVAIGTSTGGPRALQQVLTALPGNFPAPIVIVQHMPPGFTQSLALRLNRLCKISVKEAEHQEVLKPGVAYIAPGDYHMNIQQQQTNLTIHLDQAEANKGHRPAVDVLFNSIAHLQPLSMIAVVMTGMGSDGALGVERLKASSHAVTVIAESEESSIVFGMPKAAILTNLVDEIVHVNEISLALMKRIGGHKG